MLDFNGLVEFSSDTHQCGNSENSQLESHSRGHSLESAGWCTHQSSCSCSPNCLREENSKCYFKYQWLDTGLCCLFVLKSGKVEFASHLMGLRAGPPPFPEADQGLVHACREMSSAVCRPVSLIRIHSDMSQTGQ